MARLASIRFNTATFEENNIFKERKNISQNKCIYGAQVKVKPSIPLNALLFVVEMNNETNQITGIGLIRNIIAAQENIYNDNNYNRYTYSGNFRLSRDKIEELGGIELIEVFELILFKGYTHIKRHSGITIIPESLLHCQRTNNINLLEKVRLLFISQFKK